MNDSRMRRCVTTLTTLCLLTTTLTGCVPKLPQQRTSNVEEVIPQQYADQAAQQASSAQVQWNAFFDDPNLVSLIDEALQNNQELNILIQEINIANNEVMSRRGDYLPRAGVGVDAGIELPHRYEREGAEPGDRLESTEGFGELYGSIGFYATWEVDIWKKLRNSTKAAVFEYLASIEGRNFAITSLVAEIANSYYELMALDNELEVIRSNLEIQQNGLELIRIQKEAARVTELAVQRFEAEVLRNQSRQYDVLQQIIEAENRINFLVGRYPQPITRNSATFIDITPRAIAVGVPTELLENRPDIRQAELELRAAELDVQVARATFYPSLVIDAGLEYRPGDIKHLLPSPESILIGTVASLFTPLINRRAIKANYFSANAEQIKTVYNYERTVLNAYMESANQMAMIANLEKSYELKSRQVEILNRSIETSTTLFQAARADYLEVLTTRREALESQLELVETKKRQLMAVVNMYKALGGGWSSDAPPPPAQEPPQQP